MFESQQCSGKGGSEGVTVTRRVRTRAEVERLGVRSARRRAGVLGTGWMLEVSG